MAKTNRRSGQSVVIGGRKTVAEMRAEAAAQAAADRKGAERQMSPRDAAAERRRQKAENTARNRLRKNELQLATNSTTLVETDLRLPANSLVHQYQIKVTANRGQLALGTAVADLRETRHDGKNAIVIDFGSMITVDALLLPTMNQQNRLYPWLGASFATESHGAGAGGILGAESGNESRPSLANPEYVLYRYRFSEIRSEKLLLVLDDGDVADFIQQMELSLPQLPADLSLRINGGPPVWTSPGPVELGSSASLDTQGWTEAGEQLVDITEAITPLVGDPNSNQIVNLRLSLSSVIPGRLGLANADVDVQLLHRLSFNGEQRLNIAFESEGQALLGLPATAANGVALDAITGLRLKLETDQELERVLPATGPAISDKAELVLGKGRAACLRLDGGSGLEQITALRLPLRAGGNKTAAENSSASVSAEAKVILWTSVNGAPGEPLEGGISAPVSFEGAEEQWLTFAFEEPLPFDPGAPLWAAVVVSRGEAAWRLAETTEADTPRLVRIGAPDGPWRALPSGFGVGQALGQASARARVVGLAPETQPVAPLQMKFEGSAPLELDPGTEPLAVQMRVPANVIEAQKAVQETAEGQALAGEQAMAALNQDQLVDAGDAANSAFLAGAFVTLTSHAKGVVTLSDVDAITEFSDVAS